AGRAEALVRADRQLPRAHAQAVAALCRALPVVVELGDLGHARGAVAAVGRLAARLAIEVVRSIFDQLAGRAPALLAHQRAALGIVELALPDRAAFDQRRHDL